MQIPEELPVEAAVPDERTRVVDEPVAESFHQVENANEPDDDQLVATHDPFKSDLFNETNAMGPRYLPSPKSIITILNANLAKSIERVIRNQMRLGRLELEPFSTEEFRTFIRNRVSMFVKGMQASILNICFLWKTVFSRKPKSNLGLIPIIESTYPDIPRKNALLNLMAAISRVPTCSK